ncbi:hypothetical protein [Candidatus Aalborgicola defluviihabitans]|uniref:hypothetical protein n=1 Tax=Candidatus Aalborgicola defluviihabitans TaxID=3386187 RepID=UPI0039B832CA
MKHALLRWNVVLAGLCVTAGLAGCVSAPQGPRVAIMPAPGKPLDLLPLKTSIAEAMRASRWGQIPVVRLR